MIVNLANPSVQAITRVEKPEDPFIFSTDLIARLQLLEFVRKVLALAFRPTPVPRLPGGRRRPDLYPDEAILVTVIIMTIWRLSPRAMARRLRRWPALATACGYAPPEVISTSQLYRRQDHLGLWVYFVTFCVLVWRLIHLGAIVGEDVLPDSTVVPAYSLLDLEAAEHYAKVKRIRRVLPLKECISMIFSSIMAPIILL